MKLIAHRGNNNEYFIENTIEAFKSCFSKIYISGIELDIRLTKDKKLVVYHDLLIKDNNYKIKKVSSLTLLQINKIVLKNNYNKSNIPTLEEVLKIVPLDKEIMIEIKEEEVDNYNDIIKELRNILKKYPELKIKICSFNYDLLVKLKKRYPSYKVGILIAPFINNNHLDNSFNFVSISKYLLDEYDTNKETYVWSVNNIEDMKKVLKKNKKSIIITDYAYKLYSKTNK